MVEYKKVKKKNIKQTEILRKKIFINILFNNNTTANIK